MKLIISLFILCCFCGLSVSASTSARVVLRSPKYSQLKFSSRPDLNQEDTIRALLEDSPVEGIEQDLVFRIFNSLPNDRFDASGRFMNIFMDSARVKKFKKGYLMSFSSEVERKDDVEITFEAYKKKTKKNRQRFFANSTATNAEGTLRVLKFDESTREATILIKASVIGYDVISGKEEVFSILDPALSLRAKITCILPEIE